jgi:hypothetical protein
MEAVARDEGAVQDQEQHLDEAGPLPLATLMVRRARCDEECRATRKQNGRVERDS